MNGDYIILDNSAYEGKSIDNIDQILNYAKMTGVKEIVMPDILYDKNKTLYRSKHFLTSLSSDERKQYKIQVVPQGSSKKEWFECFDKMIDWDIDVIGLPRWLTAKNRPQYA